jgi:histidine kinase
MVGTDLSAFARTVARRLQPQFESKQVHLEVTGDAPLPVVVDEQRTRQILTNLIGNALTYTSAEGRVIVSGARRSGNAIIEVADTGAGLAAEDLDRVFERFYRVAGHDRPAGGSGIGLTIARSLARAQGGEVSATSPGRGRGSTFTLTFPVRSLPA